MPVFHPFLLPQLSFKTEQSCCWESFLTCAASVWCVHPSRACLVFHIHLPVLPNTALPLPLSWFCLMALISHVFQRCCALTLLCWLFTPFSKHKEIRKMKLLIAPKGISVAHGALLPQASSASERCSHDHAGYECGFLLQPQNRP